VNPVVILTMNNLEMNKQCVAAVQGQDVQTKLFIYDNGSTDGTAEWVQSLGVTCCLATENKGVSRGWNQMLNFIFSNGYDHALVINSDAFLPPWMYRRLLRYEAPFVTGIAVDQEVKEEPPFDIRDVNEHPDFSCFLIRRDAWETVGPFDETMKIYASDCSWHIEAHFKGVRLLKSNSPYYHVNSQTLKRATPEVRAAIEVQADKDRQRLRDKWGVVPGTQEYQALFSPENFGKDK
jgi:GT2 family glycosyltransferase